MIASPMILYNNKWIKKVVIPVILLIFWLVFSLLFNSYVNVLTLTQNYPRSNLTQAPQGLLVKDESIVGELTADENNLGILAIRFAPHRELQYDQQDSLMFKIKEKNAQTWLYQRIYGAGGIYELPFYPFGFPKIADSKGKTYIFAITSLKGNNKNALSLSNNEPTLVSKYVYTKSELMANKKNLISYGYKKVVSSFTDFAFLRASVIYALPLIFYLLWIIIFEKVWIDRYIFFWIFPFLILLGIAINIDLSSSFFLAISIFWALTIRAYQLESSISFLFALIILLFSLIAFQFGYQDIGARLSNWIYIFLVIGTVQLLGELKHPSEKRLTYTMLLRALLPDH